MCMCKRTEGINKKRSQRNNRSEINFRANCDRIVRHYKGQSGKGEETSAMRCHAQNPPRFTGWSLQRQGLVFQSLLPPGLWPLAVMPEAYLSSSLR